MGRAGSPSPSALSLGQPCPPRPACTPLDHHRAGPGWHTRPLSTHENLRTRSSLNDTATRPGRRASGSSSSPCSSVTTTGQERAQAEPLGGGLGWGAGMAQAGRVTSESQAWVAPSRRCSWAVAPCSLPEAQAGLSTWGGWCSPPCMTPGGGGLQEGRPQTGSSRGAHEGLVLGTWWARVWSHLIGVLREPPPRVTPGDQKPLAIFIQGEH